MNFDTSTRAAVKAPWAAIKRQVRLSCWVYIYLVYGTCGTRYGLGVVSTLTPPHLWPTPLNVLAYFYSWCPHVPAQGDGSISARWCCMVFGNYLRCGTLNNILLHTWYLRSIFDIAATCIKHTTLIFSRCHQNQKKNTGQEKQTGTCRQACISGVGGRPLSSETMCPTSIS